MSEKHIKISISRIEANRRLLRDVYVFLPRNQRYVRLRQIGQYFEQKILDNYKDKGHSIFFVSADELSDTDPEKIALHDYSLPIVNPDAEFFGEDNTTEVADGPILTKQKKADAGATVLEFPKKDSASTPPAETTPISDDVHSATVVDIEKKRAPKATEETPSKDGDEISKKKNEEKKKFFEEKMKNIRERQVQEKAQREKKDAALAALRKREAEIQKAQSAAKNILDEVAIGSDVEPPPDTINVKGSNAEMSPERRFASKQEEETNRKVTGKSENDDSRTTVRGVTDSKTEEELKFTADEVPKIHRKILANTDKLNKKMESLKETFLQKHKEGTLDNFEVSRLDPELEQELEKAIISNELGKKLVVLGMQLETIKERERNTAQHSHEEIAENQNFRVRVLDKVAQIEKKFN